jgi:hypothetical protein
MVSDQIVPITQVGGMSHTHLFEYNESTMRYDCIEPKCYAHLPYPVPSDMHAIRRNDYVVVISDDAD